MRHRRDSLTRAQQLRAAKRPHIPACRAKVHGRSGSESARALMFMLEANPALVLTPDNPALIVDTMTDDVGNSYGIHT